MTEKSQPSTNDLGEESPLSPDERAQLAKLTAEQATTLTLLAEKDILVAQCEDINQNRTERKKYTRRILRGVAIWLSVVFVATIMDGIKSIPFDLPDYALVALISATGIGSTGMLIAVLASLSRGHGGSVAERRRLDTLRNLIGKAVTKGGEE